MLTRVKAYSLMVVALSTPLFLSSVLLADDGNTNAMHHQGSVCIAPFVPGPQVQPPSTWYITKESRFLIHFGQIKDVSLSFGQPQLTVDNLPTDRLTKIAISLNGKPYAAFPLDFSSFQSKQLCMWLSPGYSIWQLTEYRDSRDGCSCYQSN